MGVSSTQAVYGVAMADDRTALIAQLQSLRGRRDVAALQLARTDLEIGRIAGDLLKCEYTSYSQAARVLGVSHTHVKALIERADARRSNEEGRSNAGDDDSWAPPVFTGHRAARYLEQTGLTIREVFASFDQADVLWYTKISPRQFDQGLGNVVSVPHMAWLLSNDQWIGIDDVNVGYGGSGGLAAISAMTRAGLPNRLAEQIAGYRVSRTEVERGVVKGSHIWPMFPLGAPVSLGDFYVLKLDPESTEPQDQRDDPSGFYPSAKAGSVFDNIIEYLDGQQLPEWVQGPRTARVFLDDYAAVEQGFADGRHGYSFVVEQGRLQLWVFMYPPQDPTQLLTEDAYRALARAGLYPAQLAEHDAKRRFWRYFDRQFGRERPPFVDISSDQNTLRHIPAAGRPA